MSLRAMLAALLLLSVTSLPVRGQATPARRAASQGQTAPRGQVAPTPPEVSAVLTDSLVAGRAVVRFESTDSVLARAVAERLRTQAPLPAIPDTFPWGATVYLPRTEGAIDALLSGRRPEWSAALALPAQGWIVLPAGRGEPTGRRDLIGEVLRHEWAHIGLHQAVGGFRGPRWFIEGYAQWAAGWDTEAAWRLRIALASNDSLSLEGLTLRWPAGRGDAEVAYLVAATVVDYLVEVSGEEALAIFIRRWGETGRFEGALREVYGLSSSRLEQDWARWARERYGWLYVLTRSGAGWGLLAALFFLMALARRRYRKDRMAELRAREIPDAPDWWMETGTSVSMSSGWTPGTTETVSVYPREAAAHQGTVEDSRGPHRPANEDMNDGMEEDR